MSVPITGNSTNSKYYNPPHTPISLPCQSALNLSSERFLRGEPLPLREAGKTGISGLSFPAEWNKAGGPQSWGTPPPVPALWGTRPQATVHSARYR